MALLRDLRYAMRQLWRAPLLTAAVALTFGLGVGANGAVFSFLNALLLEPPAGVIRPDGVRLLYPELVRDAGAPTPPEFSYLQFAAMRAAVGTQGRVAAVTRSMDVQVSDRDRTLTVRADYATSDFLPMLAGRAAVGRFIGPEEDMVAAPDAVAVLSYDFWKDNFDRTRPIVGSTLRVNDQTVTIIGVAPRGFAGLDISPTSLWLPASFAPHPGSTPGRPWYTTRVGDIAVVVVRPAESVSFQRVSALATLGYRRVAGSPIEARTVIQDGSLLSQNGPWRRGDAVDIGERLSFVVLAILLIGCGNVASFLSARADERRHDLGVRTALGATRLRLARQLAVESALVGALGGLLALIFAWVGSVMLHSLMFPELRWRASIIDSRTVVFVFGLAALGAVLIGLPPAVALAKDDLAACIRVGHRERTRRSGKARAALLAGQTGLALVLLAAAGMFVRSVLNLDGIDMGFRAAGLVVARAPMQAPPDRQPAVQADVLSRIASDLQGRPGVQDIALSTAAPFFASGREAPITVTGSDSMTAARLHSDFIAVSPNWFSVIGARLTTGRLISSSDGATGQRVAVVNESMARAFWPNGAAVGQCITLLRPSGPCYVVVGVVRDIYQFSVTEPPHPEYYLPLSQTAATSKVLVVRAAPGAQGTVSASIQAEFRPRFPGQVVAVKSMDELLQPRVQRWHIGAVLFSTMAALAVVVAGLGMFASAWRMVEESARELGIRVSLGATPSEIVSMVLLRNLRAVCAGLLFGLLCSAWLSRFIGAYAFGISPRDPVTLAASAVMLVCIAILATLLPSLRAARVDPVMALAG